MRIPFSDIAPGGIARQITDTGWSSDSGITCVEAPVAEIELELSDELTASLQGRIRGVIETACSRCGEKVDCEIDETFAYLFRVGEDHALYQKEVEIGEDEVETVFLAQAEIDLDEILAEQLILAVPVKVLCSERCRGLCPYCGISFNEKDCNCAAEHSDSPFAVLRKLKK